ncbi:MAG: hypothetical protein JST00_23090 [Deltaproteobacteria bacterium]|nr:hypothetical protein [Deltaproteobacteria bacterium]
MGSGDHEWGEAAAALGLALHEPPAAERGYRPGASFARLERFSKGRASSLPDRSHWMCGGCTVTSIRGRSPREVQVVVLAHVTATPSGEEIATHVLARIDPPLVLGLRLRRADGGLSGLLRRLLAPSLDTTFGDDALDRHLRLEARDSRQAALLFTSSGGPAPRLGRRLAARHDLFFVGDDVVDLSMPGLVGDPAPLRRHVEEAATLAAEIANQHGWLPMHAERALLEGTLRAAAQLLGFALDASRLRLDGELLGARLRVAVESEDGRLGTCVTVWFARALSASVIAEAGPVLAEVAEGAQDVDLAGLRLHVRYDRPPLHERWLQEIVAHTTKAVATLLEHGAAPYR